MFKLHESDMQAAEAREEKNLKYLDQVLLYSPLFFTLPPDWCTHGTITKIKGINILD